MAQMQQSSLVQDLLEKRPEMRELFNPEVMQEVMKAKATGNADAVHALMNQRGESFQAAVAGAQDAMLDATSRMGLPMDTRALPISTFSSEIQPAPARPQNGRAHDPDNHPSSSGCDSCEAPHGHAHSFEGPACRMPHRPSHMTGGFAVAYGAARVLGGWARSVSRGLQQAMGLGDVEASVEAELGGRGEMRGHGGAVEGGVEGPMTNGGGGGGVPGRPLDPKTYYGPVVKSYWTPVPEETYANLYMRVR